MKSKAILSFSFLAYETAVMGIAGETAAVNKHKNFDSSLTSKLKERWVKLKKQYDSDSGVRETFKRV